jgi:hypothetical protein
LHNATKNHNNELQLIIMVSKVAIKKNQDNKRSLLFWLKSLYNATKATTTRYNSSLWFWRLQQKNKPGQRAQLVILVWK